MRIDPPEDSAVRRAMSSPRPVEPPPLRPRPTSVTSNPGPSSATVTSAPPAGRGRTATRTPLPSGVCAKTLPRSASSAAPRSACATRTGSGPSARSTSIGAALLLGQHRPEPHPVADHRDRVAAGADAFADRCGGPRGSPRRCRGSSASTASSSRSRSGAGRASTSSRSAVSGVRSRWARSAAPSRSAASSSPIRPASRLTAAPTSRTSGGPAGCTRAARSPVPSRWAVAASSVTGRVSERASRSATSSARSSRTTPRPPSTSQVRVTPARSTSAGTNTSIDRRPVRPVDRLQQEGAGVRPRPRPAPVGTVDVGVLRIAEPGPVGPADARCAARSAVPIRLAATSSRSPRPTVGVRNCTCAWAASSARASATRETSDGGGQQEGQQHHRRRRGHQQGDLAPHDSGSASRTPTPRTVCSSRGSPRSRRACGAATTGGRRRSCPLRRRAAARPRRAAPAW